MPRAQWRRFSVQRLEWAGWVVPVVSVALFLLPLGLVWWWEISSLLHQHEFIGYRFFTGLSILGGEGRNVRVFQGLPSGFIQHIIVWVLTVPMGADPLDVWTLETFQRASVVVAYLLSVAVIVVVWSSARFTTADRLGISLISLTPWYAWTHHAFLLAPEYWLFEIPYSLASAAGCIAYFRQPRTASPLHIVVAGIWLAIGFTLKPSLIGIGCLPIVALLAIDLQHPIQLVVRAVSVGLASVMAVIAIVVVYFLGDVPSAIQCMVTFIEFVKAPGSLDFESFWDVFLTPALSYARPYFAVSGIIIVLASVATLFRRVSVTGLLVAIAASIGYVGGVYTLWKRPSTTSYIDLSLYALFVLPILACILPRRWQYGLLGVLCSIIVGTSWMYGYWDIRRKLPGNEAVVGRDALVAAHRYVWATGKPLALFFPSNVWSGPSLEQIALIHGQLEIGAAEGASVRNRVLPGMLVFHTSTADTASMKSHILDGGLVLWAQPGSCPPIDTVFPVMQYLTRNADVVLMEWAQNGLGPQRTIIAAYLATPLPHADRRALPSDEPQLSGVSPNCR